MIEEEKYFGKTYDQILNESIKKMSSSMEDHEFRHYNNSLDMMIYSKEHYIQEMKKRRMLPFDVCEGLAEKWEKKNHKGPITELSPKADRIIRSLKLTADRKGNIKLSDRAINALREIGAITGRVENFGLTNGFS
jgi:hypothetical protein